MTQKGRREREGPEILSGRKERRKGDGEEEHQARVQLGESLSQASCPAEAPTHGKDRLRSEPLLC